MRLTLNRTVLLYGFGAVVVGASRAMDAWGLMDLHSISREVVFSAAFWPYELVKMFL